MCEERKELLNKVDDSKRDFVKKLAIGTAYAVPVISTFSLDSIRKTARAQGVYGDPAVVNIAGVAENDFNPNASQNVNAAADYTAYWVIAFDRPMNTKFKDSLWFDQFGGFCGAEPEAEAAAKCPPLKDPEKGCNGGENWSWNKAGTKLYMGFSRCGGETLNLEIILNPKGCKGTPFQDMAGTVLPRTEGCATYCEEDAPPCDN